MKKELKNIQTFEQHSDKNLNISGVSGSTRLKLKKEWKTPYNHFQIGDNSELRYFAQKLGKTTEELIKDFENGSLDSWFEIM